MRRYFADSLERDSKKKMIVLTGPRQVGKTTLAKSLIPGSQRPVYLNFDDPTDQRIIQRRSWPLAASFYEPIILL